MAGTRGQLTPENGDKIAKIDVKNFRGSLTTVVRAQNDTPKTANITDTIFDNVNILKTPSLVRAIPVCSIENGISDICCFRGVILSFYNCS